MFCAVLLLVQSLHAGASLLTWFGAPAVRARLCSIRSRTTVVYRPKMGQNFLSRYSRTS